MANTPISPASYDVGDGVHTEVTFRTIVLGVRTPTDPSSVTFKVKDPTGAITTKTYGVDSEVIKDSTGTYHSDFQVTAAGGWTYRWAGTGTATGAAEKRLHVRPSEF